jgi:hypothetical protein
MLQIRCRIARMALVSTVMKCFLQISGAVLAAVAFSSCASPTPQSRIAQNPAKFNSLPDKHKQLVEQGQLARGMSPDAVLLAWGEPERRTEGSAGGVPTMRWDYAGLRPVYSTGFYGGYGYGGWGRYGRRGYPYGGVSPSVSYVPERRASVLFRQGKVDSWERKQ